MLLDNRRPQLDTVAHIDTPERIRFACRLAGPAQRGAAYFVDLLVRAAVLFVLALIAMALELSAGDWSGTGMGVFLALLFVLEWGYYVACELFFNGQSVGKRAFDLRVVQTDGLPIGLGESVLRNLLRAADFLPGFYVLGALVMGADAKFRRLGDLVAGTLVISERSEGVLPSIAISPPPTPDELGRFPARIPLDVDELEALETLLRRGSSLSRPRAEELAEMVAPEFARRMNLSYQDPLRFLALLYTRATGAAQRSGAGG